MSMCLTSKSGKVRRLKRRSELAEEFLRSTGVSIGRLVQCQSQSVQYCIHCLILALTISSNASSIHASRYMFHLVTSRSSYSSQTGLSHPFGLVVHGHQFAVPSNFTTGLQLFTSPLKPGACILNINLSSNKRGWRRFMLLMAALLTTSKLDRWLSSRISGS